MNKFLASLALLIVVLLQLAAKTKQDPYVPGIGLAPDLDRSPGLLAQLEPRLTSPRADQEPYREQAVRLCAPDEPGEPLEFYGRVRDENGRPLARAAVIAYGTDAAGHYVKPGSTRPGDRNPRLCGVAVTDADGWYRFATVKPGPYPNRAEPAHIHLHIDAAVHRHTYGTIWFAGDPLLTPAKRAAKDAETTIVTLRRRDDGTWTFRHDVQLAGS